MVGSVGVNSGTVRPERCATVAALVAAAAPAEKQKDRVVI
jgi:hypothetical protein